MTYLRQTEGHKAIQGRHDVGDLSRLVQEKEAR